VELIICLEDLTKQEHETPVLVADIERRGLE
jgi:hypothetical protein